MIIARGREKNANTKDRLDVALKNTALATFCIVNAKSNSLTVLKQLKVVR